MIKLLSILSCCLIGISLSMLKFNANEAEFENEDSEQNPEYTPVTELKINSELTFSKVLVNYTNIGLGTQAGAVNCVIVSRTDSNLVLAGAQNGGVWISHNAARSWKPVNDTARTLGVTSIAQNYFRPNEFYYSTGINVTEHNRLLFDIYHSVDYGETFKLVTPTGTPGFGKVSTILTSPVDSNTLYFLHNKYLTTGGSIYRTRDNCKTFQLVFEDAAGMDEMIILPDGTLEIAFNSSVWRSVTGDPGSFEPTTGITSTGYEIHLTFCELHPDIQYCTVNKFANYDFFKSIDSGQTWTYISNSNQGRRLAIKPDNPDFILAGSTTPKASLDGGLTWDYIIAGHDLRSFYFDPHRIGKAWVTSDFGVATIEVDPFTSLSFNKEYRKDSSLYSQEAYYGDHGASGIRAFQGYQDLGCRIITNLSDFVTVISGDGTYTWISKQNPDLGYFANYGGDIYRTDHITNHDITQILNQLDADHNGDVDDGTMWVHPFIMNNADDKQLYFPTFHWLWRSLDRGNNWEKVSNPTDNKFANVAIDCSHKPDPIIYWTNSDSVFVFANAATAAPFTEFGRPTPFEAGRCYVHPDRDSALYILYRSATSKISYCPDLFDPTSTWETIPLTSLPDVTILCLAFYPGNDQIILAGSKEGGLYVTLDRGLTWTKEIDMPNVWITEIKIRASDKKVFIWTYGRGTWAADFGAIVSVSPTPLASKGLMYPNPFQDHVSVKFDHEINANLEIIDMQGKLLLKNKVSGNIINLPTQDLVPGSYIIRFLEGNKLIYQAKGIRVAN